jgi:hypothetical protein
MTIKSSLGVRAEVEVLVLDAAEVSEADADLRGQCPLTQVLRPPQFPNALAEGLQGCFPLAFGCRPA